MNIKPDSPSILEDFKVKLSTAIYSMRRGDGV